MITISGEQTAERRGIRDDLLKAQTKIISAKREKNKPNKPNKKHQTIVFAITKPNTNKYIRNKKKNKYKCMFFSNKNYFYKIETDKLAY